MRTKLQLVALSLAALCFLSVGTSGCVSNTTPANPTSQFTTGTTPPQAVSDMIRYGTAVLLINQHNCTACDEANPKFVDLQMQYKDTDVRFATFDVDDNITSVKVALAYAVNETPTILVIREDGAVAKFFPPPPYPTEVGIDFNAVKSAIDEAQKWQSLNPTPSVTPTPTPPADYSSVLNSKVESGNFIMTRPFTKSTNERGNDVYKGVGRNATLPGSTDVTLVYELTNTQAEAKQVYDKMVATKLQQGYILNPTAVAENKAASPSWVDVWYGTYGSNWSACSYGYGPEVHSWTVIQQSS